MIFQGARADDEIEDEDDDSVAAAAVRGRPQRHQLAVPAGRGRGDPRSPEEGSNTPYHIIEILINSGGDNLPGVSR